VFCPIAESSDDVRNKYLRTSLFCIVWKKEKKTHLGQISLDFNPPFLLERIRSKLPLACDRMSGFDELTAGEWHCNFAGRSINTNKLDRKT